MSWRKAIHRTDANQAEIVRALEAAGASVRIWGDDGAPDLVVGYRKSTFLIEVKRPAGTRGGTSAHGQHLNTRQATWHRDWRGQLAVVRTAAEALVFIGAMKQGAEHWADI